jgi:hypothetical protein
MKAIFAFLIKGLAVLILVSVYLASSVATTTIGASSAKAQPRSRRRRRRRRRGGRGAGVAAGIAGLIIGGVVINELSKEQRRKLQERCDRWQARCDAGNNEACAEFDQNCVGDDEKKD